VAKEADLVTFCRERMAHFNVPHSIAAKLLPMTAAGNIQKFMLPH
jgi:fatty-acyl-CoA synthase